MARTQVQIPETVVQKYLEAKEGKKVKIVLYDKLGSGWHGTGYKIKFKVKSAKGKVNVKEIVVRTLMPEGFSHDFLADRAKVFVTQHEMSHHIPGHVRSYDVSGYSKDGELISIGDAKEFFQVVEVANGSSYSSDFSRIKESGKLEAGDLEKARFLAKYLAKLHSSKLKASEEVTSSIRKRHLRDAIGHGEMLMGVVDTYPEGFKFITKDGLTEYICKAIRFREKVKDIKFTPCRIHGDFHPGNIIFEGKNIKLLDASREIWGDPGDDVICLAINYVWFAVMQSGSFSGPFAELFNAFWQEYFDITKDELIVQTAGVHMAFRGVVVAHPFFYSAQSDDVRKKMISLVQSVLGQEKFDPSRINNDLGS
jgi:aminoglycoside phosphotransferase family enzyme